VPAYAIDPIRNFIRASIDAHLLAAEAIRKRQAEITGRAERVERRKQAFRTAAHGAHGTRRHQPACPNLTLSPASSPATDLGQLNLSALPSDYVDVEVTGLRQRSASDDAMTVCDGKRAFRLSAARFSLTTAGCICDPLFMDKLCFAAATTTTTATGGSSPGCMR
jgi:hypothetical protein